MGLFDWFKKQEATTQSAQDGAAAKPLTFGEGEKQFGGLDLKAALEAHSAWKKRLRDVIEGKEAMPEIGKVARDDLCLMGQWLHGEGKRQFGDLPTYQMLLQTHAEFHLCVGEALSCHASGAHDQTAKLERDVRNHSDRVQLDLVRLFVSARATGKAA
ncbi:MAG: CZB domain-containing protein [Pseudomonadota bacterium]|nr:CZB domain-containing protein [Pseudomonadota bacterium]